MLRFRTIYMGKKCQRVQVAAKNMDWAKKCTYRIGKMKKEKLNNPSSVV